MRKVKDAVDLTTNEKIYFKGHAKATYLSDGRNVEEALSDIPSAESSMFIAVYGETTYDEVVEAKNAGKFVICIKDRLTYHLSYVSEDLAYFTTIRGNVSYYTYINKATNKWIDGLYTLEQQSNKVTSLSSASTDTQYPSAKAVYDAIQQSDGGSSVTPDWNAREGEAGYIKNKPFYNNVDYVINKGGEYKNVHNESNVTFNNKILFNLGDIVDNDVITIISGPPVTLEKRYESDGTTTLIIEDIGNYLSTHPIIIGDLVTIPEIFIPDTIARKSDIVADPTVWKYLCNPLIIEEGTEVPDELYDSDRDWLKYEYPAMYKFYDGMEYKFCAKADYDRLTDSKSQDWYINMQTFYIE